MPGMESYIKSFEKEDTRHIQSVRKLRRKAIIDQSLESDLERAVIGISGSSELLVKYKSLARRIGEVVGEPLIIIDGIRDQKIYASKGGIILGDAIINLSPYDENQKIGGSSAAMNIYVPLSAAVTVHHWESNRVFIGENSSIGREGYASVGQIINREWENRSFNPDNDYKENINREKGKVLIGREEIYASPFMPLGLNATLIAIEQESAKLG